MTATPTVLITGCSSGFGLDTARLFLERGWHVIATMRTPQPDLLPRSDRLRILPLDVTREDSIQACLREAGDIDALVNNAGVGMLAPLEGTSLAAARELFETNTLGTIAMTQAVLPQFRERRAGVVVNVTSAVTLKPLPLLSVYTASKAAVNAFTESVALELAPFDVRVRMVLPAARRPPALVPMPSHGWAARCRRPMRRLCSRCLLARAVWKHRPPSRTMWPMPSGARSRTLMRPCAFPPAQMRSPWLGEVA